jgi:hypothetical protein
MSSAVLYLAIVAVWGIVLVPMWLRRDGDGIGRLLHRRAETMSAESLDEAASQSGDDDVVTEPSATSDEPAEYPVRRRRVTRAAVIARRRRRTLGLTLLTLTAVVLTVLHVTPWWFVFPPMLLLAGHLSLLRVAVQMDQAQRAERRRAAAAHAARLRRAREEREAEEAREAEREAAARTAEVIELPGRQEVYDQYTDLRAVGD